MLKEVTAYNARKNFGELLSQVLYRGDQVIINRSGKPVAAIVPVDWLEQWHERRERFYKKIEAIRERNREVPSGLVEKEVQEAVSYVRAVKRRRQRQ